MKKHCIKCKEKTDHWYVGKDYNLNDLHDCSKCAENNEDEEDFNGLDVGF